MTKQEIAEAVIIVHKEMLLSETWKYACYEALAHCFQLWSSRQFSFFLSHTNKLCLNCLNTCRLTTTTKNAEGALLRILKGSFASELSLIASVKIIILGGPHNLVCPGAPTGLNPALGGGTVQVHDIIEIIQIGRFLKQTWNVPLS